MKAAVLGLFAGAVIAACTFSQITSHFARAIPPPGGCDECHHAKIAANWDLVVAPAPLGKLGGAPTGTDVVLRGVKSLPYHREVPEKRLAIYTASVNPQTVGTPETGIQCFVCHRSPGPPHKSLRGTFPHPWGQGGGDR